MFTIGNIKINNNLFLAPMAGVNNISFMLLAKSFEAHISTAMLDAKRVLEENNYSLFPDELKPLTIQLVGGNPKVMGKATKFLCDNKRCDIIDVNLGCIEGDVLGKKGGCYLLQNDNMLKKVISSVIKNSNVPVTAKIRSGWSKNNKNGISVAKKLEKMGVNAIIVHPRTKDQKYMGKSDWNIIKEIKKSVNIPVIGSGDVIDGISAKKMLDFTNCDGVMIGRAAKGDPEIFGRIKNYLDNKQISEKNLVLQKELFQKFLNYYKKYDNRSINEIKTHACWFFKKFKNSKEITKKINLLKKRSELLIYIENLN